MRLFSACFWQLSKKGNSSHLDLQAELGDNLKDLKYFEVDISHQGGSGRKEELK